VIVISGLDQSDEIVSALRDGANDYVTKPFDLAVIVARIRTQIALKRLKQVNDRFLQAARNDLNEERTLRVQLEIEEKKFRTIFENADTGIFLSDGSGWLLSFNPAFGRLFGLPGPDAARRFSDLIGEPQAEALLARCIAGNAPVYQDIKLEGRAGAPTRWINVVLSPIEDHRVQGVVNDITERKRAEQAAQELAVTDSLTGVYNRLGFERRLEEMSDACYRHPGQRFALLMADLDQFKEVNDCYGHKAGDQVLVEVARRLEQAVRKTDFVGRLSGDEFVVLLAATDQRATIERIVAKILESLGRPIALGEGRVAQVGASIGAAVFSQAISKDELVRQADAAMYQAKQGGRHRCCFCEPPGTASPPP
jgi:diguanylate cyclase (GGDEF)-like protein/PAS domain S-box-containing protein